MKQPVTSIRQLFRPSKSIRFGGPTNRGHPPLSSTIASSCSRINSRRAERNSRRGITARQNDGGETPGPINQLSDTKDIHIVHVDCLSKHRKNIGLRGPLKEARVDGVLAYDTKPKQQLGPRTCNMWIAPGRSTDGSTRSSFPNASERALELHVLPSMKQGLATGGAFKP